MKTKNSRQIAKDRHEKHKPNAEPLKDDSHEI